MSNDSVKKTLLVALSLCIVCSVLVSTAAVVLKQRQERNKDLDIKKNLLLAAGLIASPDVSAGDIENEFKNIEPVVVDLQSGQVDSGIKAASFNQKKAAKSPQTQHNIPASQDIAKIKVRSKKAKVYLVKKNDQVEMLVLPIHGKGLWSTLYGFIALAPDTKTVRGLGFYSHGETAGLGGEVDNPSWKAQWAGKEVYNNQFEPAITVVKGKVDSSNPNSAHQIDGLAGATITSNGVQSLVNYWMGDDAFGPFLTQFRQNRGAL